MTSAKPGRGDGVRGDEPLHEQIDVDAYLTAIGIARSDVRLDRAGLAELQHAHLVHAPFENLDIALGTGVPHDRLHAVEKILDGRGGWCFELNGAFGLLLRALGFDVLVLGAAVLFDGPSVVLDHIALEVGGGPHRIEPHLVDVGFGDSITRPIALNVGDVQHGGAGRYQLIPSPQGTTLAEIVDGVPEARYRFKRVAHDYDDFAPIAASMQVDPTKHWGSKPFATRLLGPGSDRVTLTHDRLKLRENGEWTERHVTPEEWDDVLDAWFAMRRPAQRSAGR